MELYDAQNYFQKEKALKLVCLRYGTTFNINYFDSFNWQCLYEGADTWLMSTSGAYVAELRSGRLSTILEREDPMMAVDGISGGIDNAFVDGVGNLNLTRVDGSCISVDIGNSIVNSPEITTIQGSVNAVMSESYMNQEKIKELENQLKNLQPKPKRLIFAEQKLYKLK